jgi:PAS domain-containing protein
MQLAEVRPSGASRARLGLFAALGLLLPTLALINPERRIASEDVVFHAICSSAMLVLLILRLGQIAKLCQARAADLDHSRDELRRAHERVTAMFESAPIGMADPEGHILAVNGALTEFTGQPAAALVNATITRFVNPNDIALVMGLVAHTLHDHEHRTAPRSAASTPTETPASRTGAPPHCAVPTIPMR